MIEKETLARRVEKVEPSVAAIVRDPSTKIEQVTASFLTNGHIYRVQKFAPTRLIVHYIGIDEKEYAGLLSGNPDGFVEFAKIVGTRLDRNESLLEYGRVYLNIAIAGSNRLQILNNATEIKARPNLSESDIQKFDEFQLKFKAKIVPPDCSDGVCRYYAVSGQDLVLFELNISTTGDVGMRKTIVENQLLTTYAM